MAQIVKQCLPLGSCGCSSDKVRRVKELPSIDCALGNVIYMTKTDDMWVLSYDKSRWLPLCACDETFQYFPDLTKL